MKKTLVLMLLLLLVQAAHAADEPQVVAPKSGVMPKGPAREEPAVKEAPEAGIAEDNAPEQKAMKAPAAIEAGPKEKETTQPQAQQATGLPPDKVTRKDEFLPWRLLETIQYVYSKAPAPCITAAETQEGLIKRCQRYADGNNVYAQFVTADLMRTLRSSAARDVNAEAVLLKKAWDNGLVVAAYALGGLYMEGKGKDFPRLPNDAEKWFAAACDAGMGSACSMVGDMYFRGDFAKHEGDGDKDHKTAFGWYTQAAEKGDALAMFKLAEMYQVGSYSFIPGDNAKSRLWYGRSASYGYPMGMYKFGRMLYTLPKDHSDVVEAYMWFTAAARHGSEDGYLGVKFTDIMLSDAERKDAKARAAALTFQQTPMALWRKDFEARSKTKKEAKIPRGSMAVTTH